ncbi:hypothetical protein SAMN06296386_11027 [Lachnospiraceae bacterium]|nr:hypothetical protein SAMN06296386_11027 [Lachnospiraceae bacterium]
MKKRIFGLMKPLVDAHTMGIYLVENLLKDCGFSVIRASKEIETALNDVDLKSNCDEIVDWIKNNKINAVGISYRLDPDTAMHIVDMVYHAVNEEGLFISQGGELEFFFYAGLPESCEKIQKYVSDKIRVFRGGEPPENTLFRLDVPMNMIPRSVISMDLYKEELMRIAGKIIDDGLYFDEKPAVIKAYAEYGTDGDTIEKRVKSALESGSLPLIRAHFGPFSINKSRQENVDDFIDQCRVIAKSGYLDILSIGSSQLTQEAFGEDWEGRINGGGVPVNSEYEYRCIKEAARPMLVRTYAGTKGIRELARVHEESLNISWHALSLWWFDELDGRGPNRLLDNLEEHIDTIKFIASCDRAFEANVPHHFAFRGCDDVTYVAAGYLSAKLAKECGIRTFILQNMLNTPKHLWGIQDLAKARAMLNLVRELEDDSFKVLLQTRAGLDFFDPDEEEAKKQLAFVSCMMDDIEPNNENSPEIVHVVSYSEAIKLSTPEIIDESIKISRKAILEYRRIKKSGDRSIIEKQNDEIEKRRERLEKSARFRIKNMEDYIENLYSASGLYLAFVAGWLPTPYLWNDSEEFRFSRAFGSKLEYGEAVLTRNGKTMTDEDRVSLAIGNMAEAEKLLSDRQVLI